MTGREWDAAVYHRLSDHQHEWGRRVLSRLVLRGDETVMDAGCGTGRITLELARLLPHGRVLAVDFSHNMLNQARQSLLDANELIDFICADLAALPFHGAADGIFSTAVFHWVRDHDRLFASLYTALKPGGWLEAQCGGGPNLARVHARAEELMACAPYAHFFAGWTPPRFSVNQEQTNARLVRAGFVNCNTWIEPAGFSLADEQEYRLYLSKVVYHRHLERIADAGLRERFLDELAAPALSSQPRLFLDYWRLNIHARKPDA
jgi:trans-aconitate 2-methyltransferase